MKIFQSVMGFTAIALLCAVTTSQAVRPACPLPLTVIGNVINVASGVILIPGKLQLTNAKLVESCSGHPTSLDRINQSDPIIFKQDKHQAGSDITFSYTYSVKGDRSSSCLVSGDGSTVRVANTVGSNIFCSVLSQTSTDQQLVYTIQVTMNEEVNPHFSL